LNPLPFQDLEPHRFEDLVRQVAYEFRSWKSLEATGRSGSDDGMDIRAIENAVTRGEDGEEEGSESGSIGERLWIFQCKREKSLSPKPMRAAVRDSLREASPAPYGFVLAVGCDVSKKTRDAFREEMLAHGIQEFFIWARGELEDMLFQPRNDRLLFAYFGLALQPRRRSIATTLRSQLAFKKQLHALLEDEAHARSEEPFVLLRDPSADHYPGTATDPRPPRWLLCQYLSTRTPGHFAVQCHEYLAWTTSDGTGWDALLDHDLAGPAGRAKLRSLDAWTDDQDVPREDEHAYHDFFSEYVPTHEKAALCTIRFVPLERIVAIDPIGDGHYPLPHIFVEFDEAEGPFTSRVLRLLKRHPSGALFDLRPTDENRVALFPRPLPLTLFPPLPAFDGPGSPEATLSADGVARLDGTLVSIEERRSSEVTDQALPDRAHRWESAVEPFRRWKAEVAIPVFNAFVRRLRAAGHDARVAALSVPADQAASEGTESVELRVRLVMLTRFHPGYRPAGHLRFTFSQYRDRLEVEVYPPPESRKGYEHPQPPTLDVLTALELERHVLALLERLRAESAAW